MVQYRVKVSISLLEGFTAESAEIDDMRPRTYLVEAGSADDASEQAVTQFHHEVAIGNLEQVDVITEVEEAKQASNPKEVTFTYDSEDGKGIVIFNGSDGGYGPGFTITAPDGTVYTGFIDLFHFADHGEYGNGENCLQIVIDQPTPAGASEPVQGDTFHVRMYPDGKTEAFSE